MAKIQKSAFFIFIGLIFLALASLMWRRPLAASYGPGSDNFLPFVARDGEAMPPPTPTTTIVERGSLMAEQLIIDSFSTDQGHAWQFEAGLGETITVTAITADPPDLVLSLRNTHNTLLHQQNSAPTGTAATIGSFTLPMSGTFKIEVTTADHSSAEYALILLFHDSLNVVFPGIVADGGPESTQLAANSNHFWVFRGTSNQVMTAVVEPDAATDAVIELYDPDATRISPALINVGDAGVAEPYSYKIDQAGLYAIRVGQWNLSRGAYTLTLTMAPASPDPDPLLPLIPFNYSNITYPLHLAAISQNIPIHNPITDDGATLGRVLFYDKRLSANNQTACASCHHQASGFVDGRPTSLGFTGLNTRRTSMGLANLRYFQPDQFFWDTRADTLEALALLPIADQIEMGSTLNGVIAELNATSFYPALFTNAFGTPEITAERIAMALSQFLRSLVSYQSKYDAGVPINFSNFTPQEEMGRQLFEGAALRCALCHTTETQLLLAPRNNGLDLIYSDNGLGEITGSPYDNALFKPPTLRNVALTAPYMHDGRFQTLAAVIEHYSSGIQPHPNLDAFLPAGGFNLSPTQKAALVAFLHTLTDTQFTNEAKFSDPFAGP